MNYTDSDVQAIVDTQVKFKTKELQQRINKAIQYLEKFIPIDTDTIILRESQREYVISILQWKELKDND